MAGTRSEVRTVVSEEVRRGVRRAWYWVMTLAVPAVLLSLMVVLPLARGIVSRSEKEGGGGPGHVGLLDSSGLLAAEAVSDARLVAVADRSAGVAALTAGEISALFIIPEEYLKTGRVLWLHTRSGISAELADTSGRALIGSLLREAMVADALPPDVEARFLAPASFDSIVIGEGGSTREEARAGDLLSLSQIFAILLMVSVLTGSGYLLESVSDEKEDRMIEVLLTSVSPMGLLAGKVIAMGALGLAQALVWAGSLALAGPRVLAGLPGVTQIEVDPLFLAWLAAFFLAGYMVLAVVMAGIGAATSSYREGSQIAVLVYLPAVSPMVAFQLIGADADGGLARVLSFIPVTAPLTMILRMGSTEVPLAEAVASLAVTVLGGLAMLWVSARVFRAGLLLVGQRMTLASVFRALRQAG